MLWIVWLIQSFGEWYPYNVNGKMGNILGFKEEKGDGNATLFCVTPAPLLIPDYAPFFRSINDQFPQIILIPEEDWSDQAAAISCQNSTDNNRLEAWRTDILVIK